MYPFGYGDQQQDLLEPTAHAKRAFVEWLAGMSAIATSTSSTTRGAL